MTAGPRVAFVIWASTKSPLLHSMENKNHLGLLDTGNDAECLMVPQANFLAFFFLSFVYVIIILNKCFLFWFYLHFSLHFGIVFLFYLDLTQISDSKCP